MTVNDGVSPSPKRAGGAEPARPPLNPPLLWTLLEKVSPKPNFLTTPFVCMLAVLIWLVKSNLTKICFRLDTGALKSRDLTTMHQIKQHE